MVRFYTTADEAMDLYAEHLQKEYPTHLTPFHQRRAQDREAALAEAMVFWMLKNMGLRPKMNEVVGTGGADFICSQNFGPIFARREPTPESMFIVEATSLDPDAVSRFAVPSTLVNPPRKASIRTSTRCMPNARPLKRISKAKSISAGRLSPITMMTAASLAEISTARLCSNCSPI